MKYKDDLIALTKELIEDYKKKGVKIDTLKIEIDGNISRDNYKVSIKHNL